jgi:tripartite-type tricarboxylate transporter receptor subunit TctC
MRLTRLAFLAAAIGAAVTAALPAFAQSYPSKLLKLLVGYPAGGQTDQQARQTATLLEQALKQPVVVENRPGAGSLIAVRALMDSPADGYTLLFNNSTIGAMPFLIKDAAGFDPVKSVTPVFSIVDAAGAIVVHKDVPANNLKEFIEYAKKQPGKLNYGSLGRSVTMISTENFLRLGGIKLQEIPYPGAAQYYQAIIAGDIQMITAGLTSAVPHVKAGSVKALAILFTRRVPELPDVPTATEQGFPEVVLGGTNGVFAPAGTPPAIVAAIEKAALEKAKDPAIKEMYEKIGGSFLAPRGSEEYRNMLALESKLWTETAKAANIKPE